MEDEDRPGWGMERVLVAVHRRRRLALAIVGLGLTAVISVAGFLPDIYRSSATVLIDRQQIPDDLVRSTVTSGLEIRLHTISQEILSRSRLEALIERFDLYGDARRNAPAEEIVQRMRDDIRLELRGDTQRTDRPTTVAFTISYMGRDAQKVAVVTNTLASFYIEENLKVRERQAAGTADFLRVQLEEMKRKLELQEQAVTSFKERHIGELPQQMEANLATLEQINAQLRLNSDQQVQVFERRASLQKQLEDAETVGSPGGPRAIAQRLEEVRKQLTALRTRYSERYPDVARARAEISALEEQLAQAEAAPPPAGAASPQVVQLRATIAEVDVRARGLQAEAEGLRRTLARYQTRVENVPRTEQEYQKLARDYEASKEQYHSLLIRQREAEVAESMEQRQKGEQFRVIEPAVVPENPAAPNRPLLFLIGTLLVAGLALGAVMAVERIDTSFHSSEELRSRARVPLLVSIPHVPAAQSPEERRRAAVVTAAAAAVSLVAVVALSYLLAGSDDALLAGPILRSGS